MTTDNTIRAAQLLRAYLESIPPFRADPRLRADALRIIAAGETACRDRTVFEFAGRQCLVDGVPIPAKGKGLPLAWLVLAAHQHRLGAVELAWLFDGNRPAASAVQAFDRAADAAERYSPTLAGAIRSIGTERGWLVVKGKADGIICTSPRLAALCA